MHTTHAFDHCLSFINCQLQNPNALLQNIDRVKCITVSRQSGCGAHYFSEELAAYLQAHLPIESPPWTIFDRSLVEAVLTDHHLPARLARFMPEDRVTQLDDIIQDLFNLHPPSEALVRKTSETILHLAELGNVIIVGRAASIVTARLPGMMHVRLVGSLEARLGHMERIDKMSRSSALERISREDTGRERYVKKYFRQHIDDPLLYHLIINTDRVALPSAARMVGELALHADNTDELKSLHVTH